MKKSNYFFRVTKNPEKLKLLRVMKLTAILFLLTGLSVFAGKTYSQTKKLNLEMPNSTVKEVLQSIEEQSEFYFMYSEKLVDVKREVSIKFKNRKINDVLDGLFAGTDVQYKIRDRFILLTTPEVTGSNLLALEQGMTVTGTVTDPEGNPLPGVNIVEVGTTNGAVTDLDGNYSITVSSEDAVLSFSFIGYLTEQIEVGGQTRIDLTLVEDIQALDEVVVIGYGTTLKRDLSGSLSAVDGDLISRKQTIDLSHSLQGTMAGVQVTRNGNEPGSDATIRIRGITTMSNNNPLIIIDDRPGSLDDVNPQDIENITVLKDAAAASIYGSRAAAGVILIETKRADLGKLNIAYDGNYSIDVPTKLPKFVGAVKNMQLYNEANWNDGGNQGSEYSVWPQDIVDNYSTLHAQDPYGYPDYDWLGNALNDFAPSQNHHLNFTAGSENIRTHASFGYNWADKLFSSLAGNDVDYERITSRINNDITINKYFTGTVDMYFTRENNNDVFGYSSIIKGINDLVFNPVYIPFWEDGSVTTGRAAWNPHGIMRDGGFRNIIETRFGGKVSLKYEPFKDLIITAALAPNYNFYKQKYFSKKVPFYNRGEPNDVAGYLTNGQSTSVNEIRNDSYNVTTQFIANYKKSLQKHNLNLMIGNENYNSFNENMNAYSNHFELDFFPYLDLGNPNFLSSGGNASEIAYRSFFGRIIYNYAYKYLFQINVRTDGSSRFHPDYRWGTFPSASVAWVTSEEEFMKNIPLLSYLKIRGSFGVLGNDRIGTYPYHSAITFGNNVFDRGENITQVLGSKITEMSIPDISWETTQTFGIGLDAYFFDSKLNFTADYYNKTTYDMLLPLEIPDYMGVSNPDQNTGEMYTKGWEIELGYSDQLSSGLYFWASFNLSDYKSIMGNLGGTEFLGDQIKVEESEFNEWYGYKSDGLFQTDEDRENSVVLSPSVRTGDVKLLDISGPEGEPDGVISPTHDRVLLGGSLPRYLYGGNMGVSYKNFEVSVVFNGVGKRLSRREKLQLKPWGQNDLEWSEEYYDNRWSRYNTDEENLKVLYPRASKEAWNQNFLMSDYWLYNSAYFRLQNITLGYNIPTSFTTQIKNVNIYGSINNLFTIDNEIPGYDPEQTANSYFMTKSFILGLKIQL